MLSTQFRANTGWLAISKKIPSYAVGLRIDCRVSELHYKVQLRVLV